MYLFSLAAALCAIGCILVHYECLRLISGSAAHLSVAPRQRIVYVVAGSLVSHIIQILIFALLLWLLSVSVNEEVFGTGIPVSFQQSLYVSFESYASLGSSNALPFGPLRIFIGVEGLSGLVVIGWTSAFTYWCMTQYWNDH
ncbi:two pore domain potassium channel family protein [Bosea sp. BIWAKO-01]|uniref:two pore domain potassium channel family protein n=1 Tax=Bosea sp. BIWAKO-01 TaxID=506668 RepID=UPI00114D169A|nr:two pore domain potassium channel family protein [Bosea sp. BIWAKO-01]